MILLFAFIQYPNLAYLFACYEDFICCFYLYALAGMFEG